MEEERMNKSSNGYASKKKIVLWQQEAESMRKINLPSSQLSRKDIGATDKKIEDLS